MIAAASRRAELVLGFPVDALLGRTLAGLFVAAQAEDVRDSIRRANAGADVVQHDVCILRGGVDTVDVTLNMAPLRVGPRDASSGVSVVIQDISGRKRHESRLRRDAEHDGLTELLNRRRFDAELGHAVRIAKRHGDRDRAVLLLDVDAFKQVNDTCGHGEGDELLRTLAAALRDAVRATDLAFRLGGDEFAVLASHVDRAGAGALAEKVGAAATAALRRWGTGVSVGVVHLADVPDLDAPTVMARADARLYAAKSALPG